VNNSDQESKLKKIYGLLMIFMIGGATLILGGQAAWELFKTRTAASPSPSTPPQITTNNPQIPASPVSTPSSSFQSSSNVKQPASVQTERVSFPAGSTGTTVRGTLSSSQVQRYLLNCGSGQTMRITSSQGNVEFTVKTSDNIVLGRFNGGNQWKTTLPTDGDYQIDVSSSTDSPYELALEVL
jgi:hypothetical protein